MRILHINESLDPKRGGPPAVMVRLAAAQAAQGHDVTIVCYDTPGGADRVRAFLTGVPSMDKVRVVTVRPEQGRLTRARASGALDAVRSHVRGSEIVHLHEFWLPIVRTAGRVCVAAGVPYVLAPHSTLSAWSMSQKKWKKKLSLIHI